MKRGMTLVEMMVTVAILVAVSGALFSVIANFYRNNAYVLESAASVESARRGLYTALQNIREASYGDDGSFPVASAATSSITFYSDTDADGAIERVRIYISGTTLYRVVTNSSGNPPAYTGTGATSTIVSDVRNGTSTSLFKYYNASGSQLATSSTDVSQIASVSATLMIDLNPNRAPSVLTLTGNSTLRNLRSD